MVQSKRPPQPADGVSFGAVAGPRRMSNALVQSRMLWRFWESLKLDARTPWDARAGVSFHIHAGHYILPYRCGTEWTVGSRGALFDRFVPVQTASTEHGTASPFFSAAYSPDVATVESRTPLCNRSSCRQTVLQTPSHSTCRNHGRRMLQDGAHEPCITPV